MRKRSVILKEIQEMSSSGLTELSEALETAFIKGKVSDSDYMDLKRAIKKRANEIHAENAEEEGISDEEANIAGAAHKGTMIVGAFISIAPKGFRDGWRAASKYKKQLKK